MTISASFDALAGAFVYCRGRFFRYDSMALAVVGSFLFSKVAAHDENGRQNLINFKGNVSNGMECLS